MAQRAVVDRRENAFYVQSWDASSGNYPIYFQGTWMKRLAGDEPDGNIGHAIREAMGESRAGISPQAISRDELARIRRNLFRLAGVRGERQYQTGLTKVSVAYDPGAPDYELTDYINWSPDGNLTASEERHPLSAECSDEVLGRTIRDLLNSRPDSPTD
jgi:hypothetical protein